MLIHLPREHGYRLIPRTKNGPALAGYGALTMAGALAQTITTLPDELRRSLTWDRGKELSAHAQFSIASGVKVYFADPKSRGSAAPTRTPTACYANTFQRAQTYPAGTQTKSQPSPIPSTPDHAIPSADAHSRRSVQRPPTLATAGRCCG